MFHTIKIPENELKKVVAKYFSEYWSVNCEAENVSFSFDEGQFGELNVYASVNVKEDIY